jgi:hypothetical protein
MKAKLGITAPLHFDSPGTGLLRLPHFIERNFGVSDSSLHTISLASDSIVTPPETSADFNAHSAGDGNRTLEGTLHPREVSAPFSLTVARSEETVDCWARTPAHTGPAVVRQTLVPGPRRPAGRLTVVVDGSRRIRPFKSCLASALRSLPDDVRASVLIASDEVIRADRGAPTDDGRRPSAAAVVERTPFRGGCDNIPALRAACETTGDGDDASVLWICAAQPVLLSDLEPLQRAARAGPAAPPIYVLQVDPGPNRILDRLEGLPGVSVLPSFGRAEADIRRALTHAMQGGMQWTFSRWIGGEPPIGSPAREASDHLARLWAHGEVLRLAATDGDGDVQATALARAYRLVTPVSGAVVLETKEQYRESGLEPVNGQSVPSFESVPEPETWALMALGAVVLLLANARRRHALCAAGAP